MDQQDLDFIENFRSIKSECIGGDMPCSSHGGKTYCGVYVIHHLQSGKIYIGSTGDLYRRKSSHLSKLRLGNHWLSDFQHAYTQYPLVNFAYIIMSTKETALRLEQDFLDHYYNSGILFNRAIDATKPGMGLKHSDSTKETLRLKVKQRMANPEYSKKLSLANTGKTLSLETRRKIGKYNLGKRVSEETKRRMSLGSIGIKKSSEHAKKIRDRIVRDKGKAVSIDGTTYESLASAARALNIHPGSMPNRMKNKTGKYNGWSYL